MLRKILCPCGNKSIRLTCVILLGLMLMLFVSAVSSQAVCVKVYVLTGQSNALGPTDDPDETDYTPGTNPADEVTRFFWDNVWTSSIDPIGDSGGQITTLQQQQGMYTHPTFWGPEFGFARKMYAAGEKDILIVKAARSGGGNTSWSKAAGGYMYQLIVDSVNAATTQLTNTGDTFEIAGLLYMQGEGDSEAEASIAGIRIAALADNLRMDLPNASNMHTVIGGIITSRTYSDLVRKQHSLVATEFDSIDYFSNLDIVGTGVYDGTHFNKPGKLILGERFAEVFLTPPVTKPTRPEPVAGGPVIEGGTTPYAWYRADMGVTSYDGDETKLAWWQDQSGNSRHIEAFGEPKINTDVIEGKPVITLDGMNDQILGAAAEWGEAAPGTVFAVWRRSPDAQDIGFLYDADFDEQRQYFSTSSGTLTVGGGEFTAPSTWINHYTTGVADPGTDEWFVTSASSTTGVTDTLRINGEKVFSGNMLSGGMSGLRIGRFVLDTHYWKGDIAELIVFEGDLSANEREAIEAELMSRWGIIAPDTPIPGDANGDKKVDGSDVTILAGNWQVLSGANWGMGDFNGDGKVDGSDVTILAGNWQAGVTAAAASVPEPSTLVALLVMVLTSRCSARKR